MSSLLRQEITVMGQKVTIDPSVLNFNESSLPLYLQKEAGHYAYYGAMLANAEAEEQYAAVKAEERFDTLFWMYKQDGQGSDKFCECRARSNSEVIEAKEKQITAKRNVTLLKMFLKAFDKNHDNAQSTGHNLRKEMDKLGHANERFGTPGMGDSERIEEFFRKKDEL